MRRPSYMPRLTPTVQGAFDWRIKSHTKSHIFEQRKLPLADARDELRGLEAAHTLMAATAEVTTDTVVRTRLVRAAQDLEPRITALRKVVFWEDLNDKVLRG